MKISASKGSVVMDILSGGSPRLLLRALSAFVTLHSQIGALTPEVEASTRFSVLSINYCPSIDGTCHKYREHWIGSISTDPQGFYEKNKRSCRSSVAAIEAIGSCRAATHAAASLMQKRGKRTRQLTWSRQTRVYSLTITSVSRRSARRLMRKSLLPYFTPTGC